MINVASLLLLLSVFFSEVFYYEKYENKDGDIYSFTFPITFSDNWKYKEVAITKNGKKEGRSTIFRKDEFTETRVLEGFYKNDIKDSLWTVYFADGQKKVATFYYKNGKVSGLSICYYESGYIDEICFFKEGLRDSFFTSYYDNSVNDYSKITTGKIKRKGKYKNGKFHSQFESYHENGNLKLQCTYNYGFLEGLYKEYHENGKIESEYQTKNGDFEGKYIGFYENGSKEVEGEYKNDAPENKWIYYYANGNIKKEGSYLEGEENGEWIFYNLDHSKTKSINFTSGVADFPVPNWDQPEYQWGKNELLEVILGSESTKEGEIYQEQDRFKLAEVPMVKLYYGKLYNKSYIKSEWYKYSDVKSRYENKHIFDVTTEPDWDYVWFELTDTEIGKWKVCIYDNDNKIKELYFTIEE